MQDKKLPVIPIIVGFVALSALLFSAWILLGKRNSNKTPNPNTPVKPLGVERKDETITPQVFRKQGQTYAVRTIMNLHGRATHEDWGLETVMTVNYVVTIRFDEKVLISEPKKLVVERHFLEARTKLFTSVDDIDLSKDMKKAWQVLDYASLAEPRIGQIGGKLGEGAKKLKDKLLADSKTANLNWTPLLDKIGRDPSKTVRALSSKLQGRKIKIIWQEGSGVAILSGADGLPEQERQLLARASLLADGALFPNKNKRHGERWNVDAHHFNDFLDVGLDGSLRGKVALRRDEDQVVDGQRCATLTMLGGTLNVVRDDSSKELRGSLTPSGSLFYDLQDDLIRGAQLSGKCKAKFSSKDHLLFKARFKGTPHFTVSYEAFLK